MSQRPPDDLTERTFRFASDVYDFCNELVGRPGLARRVAYQLFDAAGSVGANRAESRGGCSRRDFKSKNAISLKESHECHFWLRLAEAKSLGRRLLDEANQLV